MGRKTHGPYLIAAIEYNDIEKVSEILVKQFRDRKAIRELLVSEISRLASDQTEIPLLLAASLADPGILWYFVAKHHVDVNVVFESGSHSRRRRTSALLTAVRYGHYDTVDAILSLSGDVNIADHKGRRPLHLAIKRSVSVKGFEMLTFLQDFFLIILCSSSILASRCNLRYFSLLAKQQHEQKFANNNQI